MNQCQSNFKTNFPAIEKYRASIEDNSLYSENGAARNICFVWLDGKKQFFNYTYLVSVALLSESDSVNELLIQFTSHSVILKGYRLSILFGLLVNHLPREIPQTELRYLSGEDSNFCVTEISVTLV